eukprot:TRINITY_DN5136_c0_g1_i1.p2 TRINITY_DN5136_c0_g1~~TRINITY_DN5136_c0_g1_i1.p2  ORF type:complete len:117 (-),score=32.43 TRINITY_DN5136_c0_g1_i1:11-361(-)
MPRHPLVSVTMTRTVAAPKLPAHKDSIMASELIKHISDSSFEADVLKSSQPVLVDYWAEWCGPCKMIAPILDEVSSAYEGKLQIAKLNVDENRDIPEIGRAVQQECRDRSRMPSSA